MRDRQPQRIAAPHDYDGKRCHATRTMPAHSDMAGEVIPCTKKSGHNWDHRGIAVSGLPVSWPRRTLAEAMRSAYPERYEINAVAICMYFFAAWVIDFANGTDLYSWARFCGRRGV